MTWGYCTDILGARGRQEEKGKGRKGGKKGEREGKEEGIAQASVKDVTSNTSAHRDSIDEGFHPVHVLDYEGVQCSHKWLFGLELNQVGKLLHRLGYEIQSSLCH